MGRAKECLQEGKVHLRIASTCSSNQLFSVEFVLPWFPPRLSEDGAALHSEENCIIAQRSQHCFQRGRAHRHNHEHSDWHRG